MPSAAGTRPRRRRRNHVAVSALAAALLATAPASAAEPVATPRGVLQADAGRLPPLWPGWPLHDFAGPCFPGGICGTPPIHQGWRERRERFEAMRREAAAPAAPAFDLWDNSGSPWGYVRRLPPPTPESEIQPQYRGASQVRPEFSGSGGSARSHAPAPEQR